jgi:purine nucleosidase
MVDPDAAAEVLAAWPGQENGPTPELPILCGLDLTRHIAMTPALLASLAATAGTEDSTTTAMSADDEPGTRSASSNVVVRVIEDAMRFYFESHHNLGHGYLAHLHDPLAAAVALDPALVSTQQATVDIELTGTLTRGMTVTDWSGRWGRKPNARIGLGVDPITFFDRYVERVGSFARRLS